MYALLQILFLFAFIHAAHSLSCLVIRPGYGLVSEQCPVQAVGCRIKVRGDLVEWYEWAKLYDRNQLVCVFPGEYGQESGCQRKASGSVRCWCGGEEDCNTAENSKWLYIDFTGGVDMTSSSSRRKYQKEDSTTVAPTTAAPVTTTEMKTTRKIFIKKLETRPAIYTRAPKKLTTSSLKTTELTEITDKAVDAEPTYILPTVGIKPHIVTIPVKVKGKKIMPHDHHNHKQLEKPYTLPTEPSISVMDSVQPSDSIFEETRRKLEEEMKLEEERLKEILDDDRNEESMDEPEDFRRESEEKERQKNRTGAKSEKGKMERRERARLEEMRRQQEEERLATMEREEAEDEQRKMRDTDTGEKYEYDGLGFEATKVLNSSAANKLGLAAISIVSVLVLRLL